MTYNAIKYEVNNKIARLTLNRPEKLNAYNTEMSEEMRAVFDEIDGDDDVRVVIVTGEGRGFCSGADLEHGAKTFDYDARPDRVSGSADGEVDYKNFQSRDGGGMLTLRIFECLKPVIGAINGPAVGIGATMQLPMDIRIASDKARFGFVFSQRGIVPEACSSWFLPKVVGISQALEWTYSGKVFDAEEALKGGLVKEIVPHDQLLDRAEEIAREIADNTSPVSVAMIRQMMWRLSAADHPMEAHKIDSRGVHACGRGDDAKEGVMSFLEKRKAEFASKPSKDMPEFFPWWDEREFS